MERDTHVNVEVSIVNVNAVCLLLEVDVGNAVVANVVVVHQAELSLGHELLESLSGSRDIVLALESLNSRLHSGDGRVGVVGLGGQTEGLEADEAASLDLLATVGRVGADGGSGAKKAQSDDRLHCDG